MPIAIVGFGCRFPGDVTNGEKLWEMLVEKKSARSEVPPDRFNIDAFYNPDGDRFGTVSMRRLPYVPSWLTKAQVQQSWWALSYRRCLTVRCAVLLDITGRSHGHGSYAAATA
jgi:hypothetical protein